MPLVDDPEYELELGRAIGLNPADIQNPEVDTGELFKSAFRIDNIVGSMLSQEPGLPDNKVTDGEYNPWDDLTEEEQLNEKFSSQAALSDSPQELDALRRQRAREEKDRETLANGGPLMSFVASTTAGALSPINFIPVGGVAYKTYRTGGNILKNALATASVAGVSTFADEAALHQSQLTRTYGESGANVAASVLLGGIIGSAPGLFRKLKTEYPNIEKEILDSLNPEEKILKGDESILSAKQNSVSAAETDVDDVQVEGKLGKLLTKALGFDPLSRTITSEEASTRSLSSRLANSPIAFEKGQRGSVELDIQVYDGFMIQGMEEHLKLHKQYKKNGGKLNRQKFGEAVAKEMANPKSNILEVKQAAEAWRSKVYDPIKKKAIDEGLLDEDVDVETAVNYLNRMWDTGEVSSNLNAFVEKVTPWLKQRDIESNLKTGKINKAAETVSRKTEFIEKEKPKIETAQMQLAETERELGRLQTKIGRSLKITEETQPADLKLLEVNSKLNKDLVDVDSEIKSHQETIKLKAAEIYSLKESIKAPAKKISPIRKEIQTSQGNKLLILKKLKAEPENTKLKEDLSVINAHIKVLNDKIKADKDKVSARKEFIRRKESAIGHEKKSLAKARDKKKEVNEKLKANREKVAFKFKSQNVVLNKNVKGEDLKRLNTLHDRAQGLRNKIKTSEADIEARKADIKKTKQEIHDEFADDKKIARVNEKIKRLSGKVQEAERKVNSSTTKAQVIGAEIRLKAAQEELSKAKDKLRSIYEATEIKEREFIDPETIDYDDLSRKIAGRIISTPDGRLPYDYQIGNEKVITKSGQELSSPFHKRVFTIPDELMEEFIVRDIEVNAAQYIGNMAPDIELMKEFGDVNMKAELNIVEAAWLRRIQDASAENPKKAKKLEGKKNKDIGDIAAMRDRIRGRYKMFDPNSVAHRIGKSVKDWNYLRLMGGVTASSLSEIGRVVMAEGFVNTFRDGLVPLVRSMKAFKMSASEAKSYGVAYDAIVGHGRAEVLYEVGNYTRGGTLLERFTSAAAQKYSKYNLINHFTSGVKQLHAVTMQNRLIRDFLKGKYDPRLKNLGIFEADAELMAKELKKHAKQIDGVYIANLEKWDNPELSHLWGKALRKESDRVIVVPGQEKPLFMSDPMGSVFFQFRSFMFSATQRILIAGIQGQDKHWFEGLVAMWGLGMMAYAFKQWDADREISDDFMTVAMEGVDRSGMLGVLMEFNNTLEKSSRNTFGLRPMLGISEPASRFASRSANQALLGPSFGAGLDTIFRVAGAAGAAVDEDGQPWVESDTRAFRRLVPWQNLMIFRQFVDMIEEGEL